ncbi:hypothetical protein KKB99_06710 [bacterium]|nr:hypothetical protein [bacterium]MBU1025681.1 hypothetical protein [bacterium]
MSYITFGLTIPTAVIIGIIFLIYITTLIVLGWESHSKYGLGYYCVGGCLLGLLIAYFNYRYWLGLQEVEGANYSLAKLIVSDLFLIYIGLWPYLVYHFYIIKRVKSVRSGSRLIKKVLDRESDEPVTISYSEQLSGWDGHPRINLLISESRLSEATRQVDEEIRKAMEENDGKKASQFKQYRSVIEKRKIEIAKLEKSEGFSPSGKAEDLDLKRTTDIDKQELPEGWEVND